MDQLGVEVPLVAQIRAIENEIDIRTRTYPRFVATRQMRQRTADRRLAEMRAVLETLRKIAAGVA